MIMSRKQPRPKIGRPCTLPGGEYVTVKLSAEQMRGVRRLAGPAAGTMPETIRQLVTAGLKAARKR